MSPDGGVVRGALRVRVRGRVAASSDLPEGLRVTGSGTTTVLEGVDSDRHSVSAAVVALQALGLEVVEVLRVDKSP